MPRGTLCSDGIYELTYEEVLEELVDEVSAIIEQEPGRKAWISNVIDGEDYMAPLQARMAAKYGAIAFTIEDVGAGLFYLHGTRLVPE